MQPIFLTKAEVLELHLRLILDFGGSAELRDEGLLESALAVPQSQFGGTYLHPDLSTMAAAYVYHLVLNHPFVDGNKRIGAAAARVFLLMNDVRFDPSEDEYGDLVLAVARGDLSKEKVTEFFRDHVRT
jgi:death-on-curing protein